MNVSKKEVAFEGEYLKVVRKHFETSEGVGGVWETVERTNVHGSGAVVVVAITRQNELILEKNWRVPLESYVIQLPAGLTDKEGESPEETARRELLEETGYLAREMVPIIETPLEPVLVGTRGMHFLARDVEFVGKTEVREAEEIEVLKVPLERVPPFLLSLPEGTSLDLRVPGILWVLEKMGLI